MSIGDPNYPQSRALHHDEDRYRAFPLRVVRVDADRPCVSVKNLNDNIVYDEVTILPAESSSMETNDMALPEVGQSGLGMFISDQGGFVKVAVLTWTVSDIRSNIDGIAHRPQQELEGYSTRWRGVHRKPYPGQRSRTLSGGLHTMEGAGWERLAADMSHDKLDPDRRQWEQVTGRQVTYTDAGLRFSGTVQRPGADVSLIPTETLPDGTTRQIVYLQERTHGHKRYTEAQQDLIPLAEVLEKFQEFSADFPIPGEVLEDGMLEDVLGVRADLWTRTLVETGPQDVQRDDQSFLVDQGIDHPHSPATSPIGPTRTEGVTPRRRGWILERVVGTMVGYNVWDKTTYGKILKPVLWPLTRAGRFGSDVESGYQQVQASTDHVETRMASSAFMMRFPHEYNSTRVNITKEGMLLLELGCTIPKENIPLDGSTYEHPWGAGRSLEAHVIGSAKLVLGKNRDEEESLDFTTLGQVVMRLGADDSSLPTDGRAVSCQTRGKGDSVLARDLQYWRQPKLKPGDVGDLENKSGAENVSLRAAFDGGTFLRLGARDTKSKRRHLKNGYADGQGHNPEAPGKGSRSRTKGRPTYGAGDSAYRFNDLTTAAKPTTGIMPYLWSGDPVKDMDTHGLSLDVHAVRDIFLRVGKNALMNQSILLDLEGGIVGIVGKDRKGRSLTGTLQGGIEMTVGPNMAGQAVQLEIVGDVNVVVKGNYHMHVTGDYTVDVDGNSYLVAKKEQILKGMNIRQAALVQHVSEAPDVVHNQGGHPVP